MDRWKRDFAQAGTALGLEPAKFKKEIANVWQLVPIMSEVRHLTASIHGCFAGDWAGRKASATAMLPTGGEVHSGNVLNASWGHDRSVSWSEGVLLVTSVAFITRPIPFMMAAPAAPMRINEHFTYTTDDWILPATAEYFPQLPMPGDTNGDWVIRAPRVEKPSAVLAAIAPTLLSEAPYPWKIDGGKNSSHLVDLIRVDIGRKGTPPPTEESLRDKLNQLSEMAATIEKALERF